MPVATPEVSPEPGDAPAVEQGDGGGTPEVPASPAEPAVEDDPLPESVAASSQGTNLSNLEAVSGVTGDTQLAPDTLYVAYNDWSGGYTPVRRLESIPLEGRGASEVLAEFVRESGAGSHVAFSTDGDAAPEFAVDTKSTKSVETPEGRYMLGDIDAFKKDRARRIREGDDPDAAFLEQVREDLGPALRPVDPEPLDDYIAALAFQAEGRPVTDLDNRFMTYDNYLEHLRRYIENPPVDRQAAIDKVNRYKGSITGHGSRAEVEALVAKAESLEAERIRMVESVNGPQEKTTPSTNLTIGDEVTFSMGDRTYSGELLDVYDYGFVGGPRASVSFYRSPRSIYLSQIEGVEIQPPPAEPESTPETTPEVEPLEAPAPEPPAFDAPPAEESPTGMFHAQSDADRARLGLPPRFKQPATTNQASWDRATAAEDAHRAAGKPGTAGTDLLHTLLSNEPRSLPPDEHALLLHEKLLRETKVEKAQQTLNDLGPDAPDAMRKDAIGNAAKAQEEFELLLDYVDAAGSRAGLNLQARKMLINRDYTLAGVVRSLKAAANSSTDKPYVWTDEDQKKAVEMAAKLQEAQARLDFLTDENAELSSLVETLTLDVEKAQTKLANRTRTTRARKMVNEKLLPKAEEARKRLVARQRLFANTDPLTHPTLLSGLDPATAQDLKDAAVYSAVWLVDKALTLQEFSAKLIAEFGDWVAEHAQTIFNKAHAIYIETAESVTGGSAPTPETVLDGIDPESPLDRADVWQLARAHVIAGLRGRAVLDAVFEDLSGIIPDITRDQVAESFTDYGKVIYPSKNEASKELQRVKSIERITLQMQDVREGRMPKRTGFQRGEQDAEVRELNKKLRELLRESGLQVTDPEKQLQSTLGAIKRRMANEIEELQRAIDSRTPRVAEGRAPTPLDEEGLKLKARLEAKRAEYNDMFGGRTQEQRVAAVIKSLDRQIAEEEQMLRDGVLRKPKADPVTSPEIEVRREKLRKMREHRRELYAATHGLSPLEVAKEAARKTSERLQQMIATGDVAVRRKGKVEPDAELAALWDANEALRDQIAEMRKAVPLTDGEVRVAIGKEVAAAERTAARIQAKLDAGDLSVETKPLSPRAEAVAADPRVQNVRNQIKQLNKELAARRRAALPKKSPEQAREKRILASAEKRIAELERRIREKDFSRKQKLEPVNTEAKRKADYKLDKLKSEFAEMEHAYRLKTATVGRKAAHYAMSSGLLAKVLVLGGDIGVVFRQLGTTFQAITRDLGMLAPTKEGARKRADGSYLKKILSTGIKTFGSEEYEYQVYEELRHRPNAGWDKAAGLVLNAPFDVHTNAKEDIPTANLLDKMPWWVWPAVAVGKVTLMGASFPAAAGLIALGAVTKPLLKALDRSQRAMTNQSRALFFDAHLDAMRGGKPTLQEAKAIAKAVMVGSGRGTATEKIESAIPLLNQGVLATRFYISRIQALSLYPLLNKDARSSKRARNEVAKMYARSVAGRAALYAFAAMAFGKALTGGDDDDEQEGVVPDPRNPRFGRLRLADGTDIDFMSSMNGFASIAARYFTKTRVDPETGYKHALGAGFRNNVNDEVMRFLSSKLNLTLSFATNTWKGEYFGGKPATFANALEEATTMIIVNDTVNVYRTMMEEYGPKVGAARASVFLTLMFAGAGTSVYDSEAEKAANEMAKQEAKSLQKEREAELNQ